MQEEVERKTFLIHALRKISNALLVPLPRLFLLNKQSRKISYFARCRLVNIKPITPIIYRFIDYSDYLQIYRLLYDHFAII